MGDARPRSGRPWWVPVLGFLAIFGAFVWIARSPDEADSAPSAGPILPGTLAEAALVRRPADGSADRIVLLLHGSGSSPESFRPVAEEIAGHGLVAIAVRGPRETGALHVVVRRGDACAPRAHARARTCRGDVRERLRDSPGPIGDEPLLATTTVVKAAS